MPPDDTAPDLPGPATQTPSEGQGPAEQGPVRHTPVISPMPTSHKKRWVILLLLGLIIVIGGTTALFWWPGRHNAKTASNSTTTQSTQNTSTQKTPATQTVQGLQLDTKKNYGNKYASGILPVGDSKYKTDAAKQGYIYACSSYATNIVSDKGGASGRGPWFTNNNTEYDLNKKTRVAGSVAWRSTFTNTVSGSNRLITGNGLPNHTTGVFPIAPTDPAYAYDHNPNQISSQTLSYTLPVSPVYGDAHCMGGEVGIMLTGVAIFNGFDAGGRDAGAWEVQDGCDGHPQSSGEYHYHTLSRCITNTDVSTVIGFALDGFPITGPKVGTNNILTTADLDECHGLTSEITLDGKKVATYHYVMTQDFPYSASCFRAQPIQTTPGGTQPSKRP